MNGREASLNGCMDGGMAGDVSGGGRSSGMEDRGGKSPT